MTDSPYLPVEGSPPKLEQLNEYLSGFPDAFAGIEVLGSSSVRVLLSKSATFDRETLRNQFPDIAIHFSGISQSRRDSNRLRERIENELGELAEAGVVISTLSIGDDGRIILGVFDHDEFETLLLDRYGADRIVVEEGEDLDPL